MKKGTVKWFNHKIGYGFIIAESGEEIFVHYTGIVKDGFKSLNEGEEVTFNITDGSHGVQAVDVTPV